MEKNYILQNSELEKTEINTREKDTLNFSNYPIDDLASHCKQLFSLYPPTIMEEIITETYTSLLQIFIEHPENWYKHQAEYSTKLTGIFLQAFNEVQGGLVEKPTQGRDKRFTDADWENNPLLKNIKEVYLLNAAFLENLLSEAKLSEVTKKRVEFLLKQFIDALSPSNFLLTNPEAIRETLASSGENLIQGYKNFLEDQDTGKGISLPKLANPTAFEVGKTIANTQGSVIYENELFQLIQYAPYKEKVYEKPILIVPPWINKYYIFDLPADNSFVEWNLKAGRVVFMISWVNPDPSYREISLNDYILKGLHKAVEETQKISNSSKINILGFCVGGVALLNLLSYYAQKKIDTIESATLLATPVDFQKMSELSVFVSKEQVKDLEKTLEPKGIVPGSALLKMFSLLRANDLIWPNFINSYLLGKPSSEIDLLYWNSDSTNLPAKMHIEYLKEFFLGNALTKKAKFKTNGVGLDISKINVPVYILATEKDHIVPWESAFAATKYLQNPYFVLAGAGHIAGVINPPHRLKYGYKINQKKTKSSKNEWLATAEEYPGSWWTNWQDWLTPYLGKKREKLAINPEMVIESAPGRYVLTKAPKL